MKGGRKAKRKEGKRERSTDNTKGGGEREEKWGMMQGRERRKGEEREEEVGWHAEEEGKKVGSKAGTQGGKQEGRDFFLFNSTAFIFFFFLPPADFSY